ncbi:ubiquinone biosynthesis monooxygenase Coq6p, mitochondrial [Diutina catenulata]
MLRFARGLATRTLQDVVIIGGGPAGLSILAAFKANPKTRHLATTLVEGGSLDPVRNFYANPPEEYTNRVVSLTPKSVEFMDSIGSWAHMNQNRVKFYNEIIAYDGADASLRIEFDGSVVGAGFMAVMAENINIQSSLLARVEELGAPGVDIRDQTKVESITTDKGQEAASDWPVVKLSDGSELQTRLLIGADGYNSPARHFAGITSRGWQYNRWGVVATVKMQYEDLRAVGWQRFLTTGPLAILPLTEDNATIVWSSTPELSQTLLKCDAELFPLLVTAAMRLEEVDLSYVYGLIDQGLTAEATKELQWRMTKVEEAGFPSPVVKVVDGSRARFPLKMSHADTYVAPRVALVGDAAHTIHPLAGQGLNMGQSDVAALIGALERASTRGLDLGSTLALEPYVSEAWPGNHALLGICDKLHKIFSTDFGPLVAVRGLGLKSLNTIPGVKDLMVSAISGR